MGAKLNFYEYLILCPIKFRVEIKYCDFFIISIIGIFKNL